MLGLHSYAQAFFCGFSLMSFPCSSVGKASACSAGDLGLIPRLGRSPGEGNGNPLQYACLENPMDRGAWWAAVHGVAKSGARLSDQHLLTYFSCDEQGLLFVMNHGLLTALISLVEHRLQAPRLQELQHAGLVVLTHGLSFSKACGIFPDQGSNPCPLLCQVDSYPLYLQGSF